MRYVETCFIPHYKITFWHSSACPWELIYSSLVGYAAYLSMKSTHLTKLLFKSSTGSLTSGRLCQSITEIDVLKKKNPTMTVDMPIPLVDMRFCFWLCMFWGSVTLNFIARFMKFFLKTVVSSWWIKNIYHHEVTFFIYIVLFSLSVSLFFLHVGSIST